MIDSKKQKIIELRDIGYGYKRISKELNIPVSTIRYICNNLNTEEIKKDICIYCGKETILIPHKKAKKFCCDKCRWSYWNNKRREEKQL